MSAPGKKHVVLIFVMLVLTLIGVGMGVQRSVLAYEDIDDYMKQIRVLAKVLVTIQDYYVDPEKTKTEELIKGAIHGMVNSLDRYSVFLEAEDAKEFNDQTQGSFGGLGIQVKVVDGWLTVVEPLPDTPASKAGLMSGDRVVEINGESMRGVSIEKAIKLLKGDPGSDVKLTIAREGEMALMDKVLTRAIIHVSAVPQEEQFMLDSTIGYVRLRDFTRDASQELEEAIHKLQGEGMKGLVLDLRDNVGGLLDVAVSISDLFIDKGNVIVSYKDRNKYEKVFAAEREPMGDFLMAVLVNEMSASASEIVAGCIQDHHRGIIIGPAGHKTFGKGSVQTLYDLPALQGASLKLTTAKYFTPSGRSIEDDKGLTPDIFAQVTDEQRRQIRLANKVSHLLPELVGKPILEPTEISDATESMESLPAEQPVISNATAGQITSVTPEVPITAEEVFKKKEDKPEDYLYDIELYTAYQCLKGAEVLRGKDVQHFSRANTGN